MATKKKSAERFGQKNLDQQAFFMALDAKPEARENFIALLQTKTQAWRLSDSVPPASGLDAILSAFKQKTNIPLELPFFSFFFYLAGHLCEKGAQIDFCGRLRGPESWTIVLAPSGSSKTFSSKIVGNSAKRVLGIESDFPSCDSGAALFDALKQYSDEGRTKLLLWDELAQKLKQIETPNSPLAPAKEYLLKSYDGDKIDRNTRSAGHLIVDDPRLCILGLNTDEGFFNTLSAESLVDGFAQRFAYVLAEKDNSRPYGDYARYDETALGEACDEAFQRIASVPVASQYTFSQGALDTFDRLFKENASDNLPESFFRRAMFLASKYALLYHLILEKGSAEIDAADMAWAIRLCMHHIADSQKLLEFTSSEFIRLFKKSMVVFERCKEQGKPFTAGELTRGVRGINGASEARSLHKLILESQGEEDTQEYAPRKRGRPAGSKLAANASQKSVNIGNSGAEIASGSANKNINKIRQMPLKTQLQSVQTA